MGVAVGGRRGVSEGMFFTVSKLLWFVVNPGNLLLLGLCVGALLLWTRWRRAGKWLVCLCVVFTIAIAVIPVGQWAMETLENRFPPLTVLPDHIDGVVVLGGVINPSVSAARRQVAVGGAVERLSEMVALARRYPDAKIIFSAGSGDLFRQELKEAHYVKPWLETMGIEAERIVLEDQARNTIENAIYCYRIAKPKASEAWLLVTSAFHMPRAVGTFRRAGWSAIPYPVDFGTTGDETWSLMFNLSHGLGTANNAIHEWLGLLFYWVTDKSNSLFPAPAG